MPAGHNEHLLNDHFRNMPADHNELLLNDYLRNMQTRHNDFTINGYLRDMPAGHNELLLFLKDGVSSVKLLLVILTVLTRLPLDLLPAVSFFDVFGRVQRMRHDWA